MRGLLAEHRETDAEQTAIFLALCLAFSHLFKSNAFRRPAQALVSIGATRYTDYGETTFLAKGDVSIVALYDAARFDLDAIRSIARGDADAPSDGLSLLRQVVV